MEKMKCYDISLNGKTFKYQEVYLYAAGCKVLIGSESLRQELIDEGGNYRSPYARRIGEKFYSFVGDNLFDDLSIEGFEVEINQLIN